MSEERGNVGRPRDENSAPAIKAAARELVTTRGYDTVRITDIIRAAGVSRQTLYRRWPSKAELVLEAFFETAGDPPVVDAGDDVKVRDLLQAFLTDIFAGLAQDGDAIRSLIASAQSDPEFRAVFWEKFVRPREQMMRDLLQAAQDRGELATNADLSLLNTLLHGAFWYRLLNQLPLEAEYASRLVAVIFRD